MTIWRYLIKEKDIPTFETKSDILFWQYSKSSVSVLIKAVLFQEIHKLLHIAFFLTPVHPASRSCMLPVVRRLLFPGQSVAGDLARRAAIGPGLRRRQSHHHFLLLLHPDLGVYVYTCLKSAWPLSLCTFMCVCVHHHHHHHLVCVFVCVCVCISGVSVRAGNEQI